VLVRVGGEVDRWWPQGDATPVEIPLPECITIGGDPMQGVQYASDRDGVRARRLRALEELRGYLHNAAEEAYDALLVAMAARGMNV